MRVDHRDSLPGMDIGEDHVLEQRRFAHACFSDDVDVPAAIVEPDAKFAPLSAENGLSKHRQIIPLSQSLS